MAKNNDKPEIKHSNVQDSVDEYFLDKFNKGEQPLSIAEVTAKMQLHVQIEALKESKAKEAKIAEKKKAKENQKEGREL